MQPIENNCYSMPPPSTPGMNRGRSSKRQANETPKNSHSETDQVQIIWDQPKQMTSKTILPNNLKYSRPPYRLFVDSSMANSFIRWNLQSCYTKFSELKTILSKFSPVCICLWEILISTRQASPPSWYDISISNAVCADGRERGATILINCIFIC